MKGWWRWWRKRGRKNGVEDRLWIFRRGFSSKAFFASTPSFGGSACSTFSAFKNVPCALSVLSKTSRGNRRTGDSDKMTAADCSYCAIGRDKWGSSWCLQNHLQKWPLEGVKTKKINAVLLWENNICFYKHSMIYLDKFLFETKDIKRSKKIFF